MQSGAHFSRYRASIAIAGTLFLFLALSWASWVILVRASGEPPVAVDDEYEVAEDSGETALKVLINDTDPETDTLTIAAVGIPNHGGTAIHGSTVISYTPALEFSGTEVFTYTVSDGALTDTATVTVTVTATNDAPIAVDDVVTTPEDTPIQIYVLANDSDPDSTLNRNSLSIVLQPSHGSASLHPAQPRLIYSPTSNWFGTDSFVYQACDLDSACDTATVTVTVTAVNDLPIAVDDAYTVTEATTLTVIAPGLLANDSDVDGDTLTISANSDPISGTLLVSASGAFTYTPAANFQGVDAFTYTATDGVLTDSATVTITVTAENGAPIAVDDIYTVTEGIALTVAAPGVMANDYDVDGDVLTVADNTAPLSGTLNIDASGAFTYTPAADFWGTDAFTYTVSDGVFTDTATVTIAVTARNDAPIAVNDLAATDEDIVVSIDVLDNDVDPDGDPLQITIVGATSQGGIVVNGHSVITYTPPTDFYGIETFSYTVSDGLGADTATVTVTVVAINDAPVAGNDFLETDEDSADNVIDVLENDTDVENDTLQIVAVGMPNQGGTAINWGDFLRYTPATNFYGTETIAYTVSDDRGGSATGTVTVVVAAVNDPPVAAAGVDRSVDTNSAVILDGSGSSDLDGDNLTYGWTQTGGPQMILSSYTAVSPSFAAPGDPASLTFRLSVTDTQGVPAAAPDEVVITVRNQPPVANAGPDQDVLVNETVTLDASGSLDPDDDLPLARLWMQAGGPPVTLSNPAAVAPTFVAPGEPAVITFRLVVTDALGLRSAPGEIRITVSDRYHVYLPLAARRFVVGPDLVVRSVTATANNVKVRIANQGNAPVREAFWLEVYIDPHTAPTAVNQLWRDLGSQGLVWAVNGGALAALVPGGEVTLSANTVHPDESKVTWPIPPGTRIYAQVDSYGEIGWGAVLETHEIAGLPHNNISGPFLSTAATATGLAESGP